MAGPVPAIYVFGDRYTVKTWMPGTSPGMTRPIAVDALVSLNV